MRRPVQPLSVARRELLAQPRRIASGELADRRDAELGQACIGLGSDAGDLAGRQGPDTPANVIATDQGDTARFVEVGGDLGDQLVWRDTDRAAQPGRIENMLLQCQGEFAGLRFQRCQIEIDLVDAAVFDRIGHLPDCSLELARDHAVALEIDRQKDAVRAFSRRNRQWHARVDAECACFIRGGRHHAAAGRITTPADGHRAAAQVRTAQQFDRRVKGIHVEMRNAARTFWKPLILQSKSLARSVRRSRYALF